MLGTRTLWEKLVILIPPLLQRQSKSSPPAILQKIPRDKLRQGERRQMGRRVSEKSPVEKRTAFPLQIIQKITEIPEPTPAVITQKFVSNYPKMDVTRKG